MCTKYRCDLALVLCSDIVPQKFYMLSRLAWRGYHPAGLHALNQEMISSLREFDELYTMARV